VASTNGRFGKELGSPCLAGLLTVLHDPGLACRIGLGPAARVLVIDTEGATDPALCESTLGRCPAAE